MGLDSVELVMEWDKFFHIEIPDKEAVKMRIVQNAVDYISLQFTYPDESISLKNNISEEFKSALSNIIALKSQPSLNEKIFELIDFKNNEVWKKVSEVMGYEMPQPLLAGKRSKFMERFFPLKIDYVNTTIERFIDLICAVNYKSLVNGEQPKTKYEVMIAIMGITIDKMGISPFEVYLESSFTNDLGLD